MKQLRRSKNFSIVYAHAQIASSILPHWFYFLIFIHLPPPPEAASHSQWETFTLCVCVCVVGVQQFHNPHKQESLHSDDYVYTQTVSSNQAAPAPLPASHWLASSLASDCPCDLSSSTCCGTCCDAADVDHCASVVTSREPHDDSLWVWVNPPSLTFALWLVYITWRSVPTEDGAVFKSISTCSLNPESHLCVRAFTSTLISQPDTPVQDKLL